MKVNKLQRIFLHKVSGQDIRLTDPNENFTIADVQHFYSGTYPVLTNAKITGPEIINGEAQYRFETTMGTKG